MATLNPFKQLSALFRLPGQMNRTAEAQAQADATAKALAEKNAPGSPIAPQTPQSPAPTANATPGPDFNAQLAAIGAGLQNLQTGLTSYAKTPATPLPDAFDQSLTKSEDAIRAASVKSEEEIKAEKDLADLAASSAMGQQQTEERVIPMSLITGEQQAIERRAGIKALPLQAQLAALQARRQAALDTAKVDLELTKARQERARPDEEKVDEFTDAKGNRTLVYRDKRTGTIRNQVVGTATPGATQTERDRVLKTEAIKVARPALIAARGSDGYVDSNTYLKLRNDYAEAIGNPSSFDSVFAPMLSPKQREALGLGRAPAVSTDIGAVLSAYLSGATANTE